MNLTLEHVSGGTPVAVLSIHGDLDGSNFQDLIAKSRELYAAGTRRLLLDLSDMPYMSSAGLVALHSIALLLRGEEPPDPEDGWAAFHAVSRDQDRGVSPQQNVKLLNPQSRVTRTLEMTGMNQFFPIYTDRAEAITSF
ncbi:MAG TPA: STAS domain-containing protein [Anaerolineae bacterium]|nr:STAS domain-containing protein [Anaerolineae bacterium]